MTRSSGGRRVTAPAPEDVTVPRPGKELFPDEGITKRELADYYRNVSDALLPHVRDRPLTMQRFPGGIAEDGFVQQAAPEYFPSWVRRLRVDKEDGTVDHVVADDAATLVYLAGQACITPHVWLSRAGALNTPDQLVFDLDPQDGLGLAEACEVAVELRDLLHDLGLTGFVKATGGRGVHVTVPLAQEQRFDEVRGFAQDVAGILADAEPDRVTVEQRKTRRGERVFVDTLRNAYAQTVVAPYAVRARPDAGVAAPLDWDELAGGRTPRRYDLRSLPRRLAQHPDPWADIADHAHSLEQPARRLQTTLGR